MKKLLLIFLFATTQLCAQEIPQPVAGSFKYEDAELECLNGLIKLLKEKK